MTHFNWDGIAKTNETISFLEEENKMLCDRVVFLEKRIDTLKAKLQILSKDFKTLIEES
tara:strand:+ start:319 stop:495 length:177 start_codon:yes stop_codon:yes gene_type:complete